jgi:hypothetical protein
MAQALQAPIDLFDILAIDDACDVKLHVQPADVYYLHVFDHCGSAPADSAKLVHDAVLIAEVASVSSVQIDRREKLGGLAYSKSGALPAECLGGEAFALARPYVGSNVSRAPQDE